MKLSQYLFAVCIKYKVYFVGLITIAILSSICKISVTYQIKNIIDTLGTDKNANVFYLMCLFVFFKLMHHGVYFIKRLLDIFYKPQFITDVIENMYSKTVNHSLHWFDSHLSGEICSKIESFQQSFINIISNGTNTLGNIFTILISIIFLWSINIQSAFVIIGFICFYLPIMFVLLSKQMKLQQNYVGAHQEAMGCINDSVANIFAVKCIGNIANELQEKIMPTLFKKQKWDKITRQFDAYFVDCADTLMVVIMSAIQIFLLAYLYRSGQITAGGFAFIMMVTISLHAEIETMLENILFTLSPAIANIKKSFEFISQKSDVEDQENAIVLDKIKSDIEFENMTFSYNGVQNIFNNFSLKIPAGQKIGIVGKTGAGKTTLIKALIRYFDIENGAIFVDQYNIKNVSQESLRKNISIIPQDITMFHRTILENLQIVDINLSMEQIISACKQAEIHDDIMKMPMKYDTIVGERGIKLSGGQRQRIAIARAILKNAPILILDEATSALDSETEQKIQKSIHNVLNKNNITIIAIAHRLSTIKHLERIIVVNEGKIIEDGNFNELIAKNGAFKILWDAQVDGMIV